MFFRATLLLLLAARAAALDNGWRLPPMGWSSWYGFTQNINEALILDIAEGLTAPRTLRNGSITSLAAAGFVSVWIDVSCPPPPPSPGQLGRYTLPSVHLTAPSTHPRAR